MSKIDTSWQTARQGLLKSAEEETAKYPATKQAWQDIIDAFDRWNSASGPAFDQGRADYDKAWSAVLKALIAAAYLRMRDSAAYN